MARKLAEPDRAEARVILHTARYSYAGPDRLDITRQGNDPRGVVLAPSWDILGPVLQARQRGLLTDAVWHTYRLDYIAEMRASFARTGWREIIASAELTLVCFCPDAERCHRSIAAELLVKATRGAAQYRGERAPPEPAQRSLFS